MTIPHIVIDRASGQGGYVTRDQLLDMGVSERAIARRVKSGALTVAGSAVYQVIPSTDHIDLLRGAVMALPDPVVVSHESAAHLLRFPCLPVLEPTVTVVSRTTHTFRGVTVRRTDDIAKGDVIAIEGLPVTSIVRTVYDLAGVLTFKRFDAIAEGLVIDGRLTLREVERAIARLGRRGKRGTVAMRTFAEARSAGSDPNATVLERRGRSALARAGLPAPVPQYPIPWAAGRRFDDAYPDVALAIEWDSRAWHSQQKAIGADRRRDRDAAVHGWLVVRFTWQDVTDDPDRVATTVGALLDSRRSDIPRTQGS